MKSSAPSLMSLLLVVPEAHRRQLDLNLQTAYYDVFHRARINQICHAVCMGPIVWSLVALVSATPWSTGSLFSAGTASAATTLNLGLVFAALLALAYFRMARAVGLAMTPVLVGFWLTANLFVHALGPRAVPSALVVLAVSGALQTWTHAFEEIPPPLSGSDRWVTAAEWRRITPLSRQVAAILLSVSVYILVEIVSSPRLLGVLMMKLLFRLGHEPGLRGQLAERSRRILSGDPAARLA